MNINEILKELQKENIEVAIISLKGKVIYTSPNFSQFHSLADSIVKIARNAHFLQKEIKDEVLEIEIEFEESKLIIFNFADFTSEKGYVLAAILKTNEQKQKLLNILKELSKV